MKKAVKSKTSGIARIGIGTAIALSVLLALICVMTALVLNETIQEGFVRIGLMICVSIAIFIGSLVASMLADENKLAIILGTTGGFWGVLLILNILLFPGGLSNVPGTLLATGCGGILAFFVGNVKKGKGYKRVKKYRFG